MFDIFHRNWIYATLLLVAGCTGCAMFGGDEKPPEKLVDEMAENCRSGMAEGSIHKEDDEMDAKVKCK